ncbi:MAG: iron-containing alcohol dehydrogenase [Desulfobacterales bacterium]|nr:MAG: iron-containing alcohol dehydrogenase [Desulfobacterales bacterium]
MDITKIFEFKLPTRILFGVNLVDSLGEEVKALGIKRVLLVTDKGVVNAGLLERVTHALDASAIDYAIFDSVEANPTTTTVNNGAEIFRKNTCDGLVALGGGSPMDAAKGIGVQATHEGDIMDYSRRVGKPIQNITPPLVAIPTTAGTGSEVTWVSVLVDPKDKVKIVVPSPYIAANVALVDPSLTASLPPAVTAFTGMDALTHAIEAYVSIKSQPIADSLAWEAIQLISSNLREAVGNGDNLSARAGMLLASTMAGMAFVNASVGLVHAVAHALGGFFNIAHGIANAVMLPLVMRLSLIGNPGKYADIAVAMGESVEGLSEMEAAREAVFAVESLAADVGIPQDLKQLGADPARISDLADETMNQSGAYPFNPRKVGKQEIVQLFEQAFEL